MREQFRATNDRDFERAMTYYADDVVLVVEEGFLSTGAFEGQEAVGEWFGDWFRAFAMTIASRSMRSASCSPDSSS